MNKISKLLTMLLFAFFISGCVKISIIIENSQESSTSISIKNEVVTIEGNSFGYNSVQISPEIQAYLDAENKQVIYIETYFVSKIRFSEDGKQLFAYRNNAEQAGQDIVKEGNRYYLDFNHDGEVSETEKNSSYFEPQAGKLIFAQNFQNLVGVDSPTWALGTYIDLSKVSS